MGRSQEADCKRLLQRLVGYTYAPRDRPKPTQKNHQTNKTVKIRRKEERQKELERGREMSGITKNQKKMCRRARGAAAGHLGGPAATAGGRGAPPFPAGQWPSPRPAGSDAPRRSTPCRPTAHDYTMIPKLPILDYAMI